MKVLEAEQLIAYLCQSLETGSKTGVTKEDDQKIIQSVINGLKELIKQAEISVGQELTAQIDQAKALAKKVDKNVDLSKIGV